MNNFPDWMAQYQNYNQAQNMFNFLQNQQNMPNQLWEFKEEQTIKIKK